MPGEMSLCPDICLLTKPPKDFCFLKVPNVAQKSRLCYWKTIKTAMCYGGFCVNYSSEALQGTGGWHSEDQTGKLLLVIIMQKTFISDHL